MAMEGKAAFSEALKGDELSEAEKELELAEFGRVYRSFRKGQGITSEKRS